MIENRNKLPNGVIAKRSARAKRFALRLNVSKGHIDLIVPKMASIGAASAFAWGKQEWIEGVLEKLEPAIPFEDGAVIPICGCDVRISVESGQSYSKAELQDGILNVRLAVGASDAAPVVARFLINHARQVMLPIVENKANIIGQKVNRLSLRDMKSRWGSCSTNGRISISWRLIFAPPCVMDYIIAHEVAHLRHHNHSQKFWDLCEKLSQDFNNGHKWISKNGHVLLRFGVHP